MTTPELDIMNLQIATLEETQRQIDGQLSVARNALEQEQSRKAELQTQLDCERQAVAARDNDLARQLVQERATLESTRKELDGQKLRVAELQKEKHDLSLLMSEKQEQLTGHQRSLAQVQQQCNDLQSKLLQ